MAKKRARISSASPHATLAVDFDGIQEAVRMPY
jgi:hypothetical protein